MSLIASRRLHVRDDGAGDSQAADVSFAEFESEDAIVLLGDPGMGKTTLFRQLAGSNYQTVRTFLIDPNRREPVFLDALDEYRAKLNNRGAADAVAEKLIALKRPRFRLSCRIADWFGAIDQDILRLASPSRRVVVLEIRPLSRDEIAEIAEEIVSDPWTFIAEAEEAGLYGLLGNPQSLHLFAKAWSSGKKTAKQVRSLRSRN
jgi:energy-coupling factor transporter ATP-binding protein EcfA2